MSLKFVSGDIFNTQATAIAIPVNCRGAMGRGLALQAKIQWPKLYERYHEICRDGRLTPGATWWRKTEGKIILCAATKDHWRHRSDLQTIEMCLDSIRQTCEKLEIRTLALPALGCGEGGLEWQNIEPLVVNYFDRSPIKVEAYVPLRSGFLAPSGLFSTPGVLRNQPEDTPQQWLPPSLSSP